MVGVIKTPLAITILFTSKGSLYMFIDFLKKDAFNQTKIPIKGEDKMQRYVLQEDIKEYII